VALSKQLVHAIPAIAAGIVITTHLAKSVPSLNTFYSSSALWLPVKNSEDVAVAVGVISSLLIVWLGMRHKEHHGKHHKGH
jgi:hypothetical protein